MGALPETPRFRLNLKRRGNRVDALVDDIHEVMLLGYRSGGFIRHKAKFNAVAKLTHAR